MKVLILSASYGMGHTQATETLEQAFQEQGDIVQSFDLYKEAHPVINRISQYSYIKSYSNQNLQDVYRFLYDSTKTNGKMYYQLISPLFSLGVSYLKNRIESFRPDAIISTFPFLAYMSLRKKSKIPIPFYFLITDYYPHVQWLHPDANNYFIGHEKMLDFAHIPLLQQKKFVVTGIPVRKEFNELSKEKPYHQKLKILISAGAFGAFPHVEFLLQQLSYREKNPIEITIITGKNKLLHDSLKKYESENVKIKGYVSDIYQDMIEADFMLTKPGGISVTECMHTQTPLLFYKPPGGQEMENAKFLESQKSARIVYSLSELLDTIHEWATNRKVLMDYQENIGKLSKKDSHLRIVEHVKKNEGGGEVNG